MPILGDDVELFCVVHWRGSLHIRFSDADVMVREVYGDVVGEDAPVESESYIAGVVEDDDEWDLGDITFSKE